MQDGALQSQSTERMIVPGDAGPGGPGGPTGPGGPRSPFSAGGILPAISERQQQEQRDNPLCLSEWASHPRTFLLKQECTDTENAALTWGAAFDFCRLRRAGMRAGAHASF